MSTDDHLRPIRPIAIGADVRPARQLGPVGTLAMLPVSALVVDTSYQRDIRFGGRANIVQIIENWDWRRFGVIVVARVGAGRYAVIDGQHRATAALLHPDVDMVPAYVIDADQQTAASVFAALNQRRQPLTVGDMLYARNASGEMLAGDLMALCAETGIRPLRAKATNDGYQPGETTAVAALERVYTGNGVAVARAVFAALAHPKHAGQVRALVIYALADVVAGNAAWRDGPADLAAHLSRVRLVDMLASATAKARAERTAARPIMAGMLERALALALERSRASPGTPQQEAAPAP